MQTPYIEQIPIPNASDSDKSAISSLVDQILTAKKADPSADVQKWEQEIDTRVAALYGITAEDLEAAAAPQKPLEYWTSHPLLTRIAQGETHTLEFKRTMTGDERDNILREIAGMRNADGGTVLIGVEDDGKVVGIAAEITARGGRDSFLLGLQQRIDSSLTPAPMTGVKIEIVDLREGPVCQIDVSPHPGITYKGNDVIVRIGTESRTLAGRQLVDWQGARQT